MGCNNSKPNATDGAVNDKHANGAEKKPVRKSAIPSEDRIECSAKTASAVFGGVKVRYAFLSQRGYYPDDDKKANQDAYSIRTNFCSSNAASSSENNDAFLAVYDGHGRYGDKCAIFAKNELPMLIERAVHRLVTRKRVLPGESPPATPSSLSLLTKEEFQAACKQAHLECNKMMHKVSTFDDDLSGTTAISVIFHGERSGEAQITVCNVGDSRAILGQKVDNSGSLKAIPLSLDQTPYRRDERRRIKKTGARILSLDQIEGLEPVVESDGEDEDFQLGETIDEGGDPPRVWAPKGEYPGTAFTRSLGDRVAEEFGVHAEPEMITRPLTSEDKIIAIASDGVFEFLTNQSVVDICAKFDDPLEACRAVVAESYELWLQYELRTDDITMICVFVDEIVGAEVESTILGKESFQGSSKSEGSLKSDFLPLEAEKPARSIMSKKALLELEHRKSLSCMNLSYDDHDDFDINEFSTPKSDDDKARISEAIKASVIFQDINDKERDMICSAMENISVKAGDWIIRQGEMGDKLYIAEEGRFEVRVLSNLAEDDGSGGTPVHVYFGSRSQHAHPTFGEIALRHHAPRQASVIALTDGQVWALHRCVFNRILLHHNARREVRQHLRKLRAFRGLTADELQKLVDNMEEKTYVSEKIIVNQGDIGNSFFYIVDGSCVMMSSETGAKGTSVTRKELNANDYFGEEMLLKKGPYEGTVKTVRETKLLMLTLTAIEENVGSLTEKIRHA